MSSVVAYVAGHLALSAKPSPSGENPRVEDCQLTASERAALKRFIETSVRLAGDCTTVSGRWLLANVDSPAVGVGAIAAQVLGAWGAGTPSFVDFCHFCRGYFDLHAEAKFSAYQAAILQYELGRVQTAMPRRFQELYFELSLFLQRAENVAEPETVGLDISLLRDALAHHVVDFPALPVLVSMATAASAQPPDPPAAAPQGETPTATRAEGDAVGDGSGRSRRAARVGK